MPMPLGQSDPAACVALPVTVREVVALPPSVMLAWAGLKLQVMPMGSPVQLKFTVPAIPVCDATCRVTAEEVFP